MFFQSLPLIQYTAGDQTRIVTNILASVRRKSGLTGDGIFTNYTIADGDTPEIVADKLYGHTQWWWVVLLVAGIVKPEQWPCSNEDLVKILERTRGDTYQSDWILVDDNGNPAPQRVRTSFQDENGNTISFYENGEGLGAEAYGIIHMRGTKKYVEDVVTEANDALRDIQVLQPQYLGDFIEDFRRRMNERVADGVVNF